MEDFTGFAGTYTNDENRGIFRFSLEYETGRLHGLSLYYDGGECKYLTLKRGMLSAVMRQEEGCGVAVMTTAWDVPETLGRNLQEGVPPCFVRHNGHQLYTANYHEGTVRAYTVTAEGLAFTGAVCLGKKAGCHQVLFHRGLLLVPCLEQDRIVILSDGNLFEVGEISFPTGSGPRHGAFNPSHGALYVVTERSCELFSFEVKRGSYYLHHRQPILAEGVTGKAAAVRLSKDGRFLYASVREANKIAVFALEEGRPVPIQEIDCGGKHPRDMIFSPDGRFLLIANRDDGMLVCLPCDTDTGLLSPPVSKIYLPQVVTVAI